MKKYAPTILVALAMAIGLSFGNVQAALDVVGGGSGTITTLDQFTSTTSPVTAIVQRTFGKAFRLSGQSNGCAQFANSGVLSSTGVNCGTGSGGGGNSKWATTTDDSSAITPNSATKTRILLASSTALSALDGLFAGRNASTSIYGDNATSTFSGGLSSLGTGGGLASNHGVTVTGGNILLSSGATSTANNGLDLTAGCFSVSGTCLQTIVTGTSAYKQATKYTTTAVLSGTPTYANGSSGVGATLTEVGTGALSIDSSSPAVGDRVLIKNEVSQLTNGIYTVTATGSGIASYILTRATDYNSSADVFPGVTNFNNSGTVNANTCWILTNTTSVTIGTTALTYDDACGAGSFSATAPIAVSGTTISLNYGGGLDFTGTNLVAQVSTSSVAIINMLPYWTGVGTPSSLGNTGLTWDSTNNLFGVSTTTPWGTLSVGGGSAGTRPLFIVASSSTNISTSTAFIVGNNGNIGVGTTTPTSIFSISATSSNAFPLFTLATSSKAYRNEGVASSTAFTVDKNGKVGIGTTTPGTALSVAGAIDIVGNGTSTFENQGINVTGGCFAINGSCVGGAGGGTVTSITCNGGLSGGAITTSGTCAISAPVTIALGGTNNTTAYTSGSAIFSDGSKLTQNNGFFFWDNTNNRLGVATATPFARLSLGCGNNQANACFNISSSSAAVATSTLLIIDKNGRFGYGTTTPNTLFQIFNTATTTISIDTNSTTAGACIEMKDFSGGGYTYLYTKSGALYTDTVSCK